MQWDQHGLLCKQGPGTEQKQEDSKLDSLTALQTTKPSAAAAAAAATAAAAAAAAAAGML